MNLKNELIYKNLRKKFSQPEVSVCQHKYDNFYSKFTFKSHLVINLNENRFYDSIDCLCIQYS